MVKKIFKIIGILILAFLFIFVGQGIGYLIALPMHKSANAGIQFSAMYADFIGIWILCIAFCLIFKPFRKMLPKLGTKEPGNNVKTALIIGLILGLGFNLFIGILAMLHGDISLSYSSFNPLMIVLFIVVIMIQSGAEELVDRFFIYEKTREYFPNCPAVAIVLNALFFMSLHLGNPGVGALALLNLVLVGILYSLVVYYYKSFWAAVVAHTSWNFCQNILLGLPNSGIVTEYSVFSLDAANARNSFTYNTAFGIEGTIMSCLLLAIGCIVVIYFGKRKNNN